MEPQPPRELPSSKSRQRHLLSITTGNIPESFVNAESRRSDRDADLESKFEALLTVQQNGWALDELPAVLKADREVVLAAIEQDPSSIEFAAEELKGDLDIMLTVIASDPWQLEHASIEMRDNKDLIMKAVSINGNVLCYASSRLRGDKECLLRAVRRNGQSIEYASSELKDDVEVISSAARQDIWSLTIVADVLRNNSNIRKAVLNQLVPYSEQLLSTNNVTSISHFNSNERELVLSLFREVTVMDNQACSTPSTSILKDRNSNDMGKEDISWNTAQLSVRNDKKWALAAVRERGYALELFSRELRDDEQVVLTAVRNFGAALAYASERLRNDERVVLEAMKSASITIVNRGMGDTFERGNIVIGDYDVLRYASEGIRGNKNFLQFANKEVAIHKKAFEQKWQNEENQRVSKNGKRKGGGKKKKSKKKNGNKNK